MDILKYLCGNGEGTLFVFGGVGLRRVREILLENCTSHRWDGVLKALTLCHTGQCSYISLRWHDWRNARTTNDSHRSASRLSRSQANRSYLGPDERHHTAEISKSGWWKAVNIKLTSRNCHRGNASGAHRISDKTDWRIAWQVSGGHRCRWRSYQMLCSSLHR